MEACEAHAVVESQMDAKEEEIRVLQEQIDQLRREWYSLPFLGFI